MSRLRGRDVSSHTALIQTNLNGYHTGQVLLLGKEKQQKALPLGNTLSVRKKYALWNYYHKSNKMIIEYVVIKK